MVFEDYSLHGRRVKMQSLSGNDHQPSSNGNIADSLPNIDEAARKFNWDIPSEQPDFSKDNQVKVIHVLNYE